METPEAPLSTSSIDLGIAARLEDDKRFRERYFHVWASNEVATQLRNMRKLRTLRQADLAEATGTKQSAISRIEKQAYDAWTFKTLLTIANALKARIDFKLTPLEEIVAAHREREEADAMYMSEEVDFEEDVETTLPSEIEEMVRVSGAVFAGTGSTDHG